MEVDHAEVLGESGEVERRTATRVAGALRAQRGHGLADHEIAARGQHAEQVARIGARDRSGVEVRHRPGQQRGHGQVGPGRDRRGVGVEGAGVPEAGEVREARRVDLPVGAEHGGHGRLVEHHDDDIAVVVARGAGGRGPGGEQHVGHRREEQERHREQDRRERQDAGEGPEGVEAGEGQSRGDGHQHPDDGAGAGTEVQGIADRGTERRGRQHPDEHGEDDIARDRPDPPRHGDDGEHDRGGKHHQGHGEQHDVDSSRSFGDEEGRAVPEEPEQRLGDGHAAHREEGERSPSQRVGHRGRLGSVASPLVALHRACGGARRRVVGRRHGTAW